MKKSRILLWLIVLAVSLTGIALHQLTAPEGELPHPLNGVLREVHGVASAFGIFLFGYFFASHAQRKIAKRQRGWSKQTWDGYLHLSIWSLLIISGLLLYYPQTILDMEGTRIPFIHWLIGLTLILIFPLHFWRKNIKHVHSRRKWQRKA